MKANVTALLVALAVACTLHIVNAQTNVNLNIQLYAGLSVMGQVGRVYQVQYATEVSDTNTWYALQHFELNSLFRPRKPDSGADAPLWRRRRPQVAGPSGHPGSQTFRPET